MKTLTILAAVVAAAAIVTAGAMAADPEVPFPAAKAGPVWVAAHTVTPTGAMASWFAPGDKVVFRAYAVDVKTTKVVRKQDVQYFYVTVPNQPNVKLAFNAAAPGATAGMPWSGTWTVPADYPAGQVSFKMLIKLKAKRTGSFVQMPVATATLNISKTAPLSVGDPATAPQSGLVAGSDGKVPLAIYVDSVNGTAPAGTAPRAIGCTQTNVYHRGERVVIRSWGNVLATGDILNNDTVQTSTFTVPGVATPIAMAWGAHGATGAKVWFWTNFWIVPKDYPLGDAQVTVTYKTFDGKTGSYIYPITIIP